MSRPASAHASEPPPAAPHAVPSTAGATGLCSHVVRIEVRPAPGRADPIGASVVRDAAAMRVAVRSCTATRVYLIEADLDRLQIERIATALLTDPITEEWNIDAGESVPGSSVVEVHPLPGVMDPVALSVRSSIVELLGLDHAVPIEIATGWRYDLRMAEPEHGRSIGAGVDDAAADLAARLLANPVIHRVVRGPFQPVTFPRVVPHEHSVVHISVRGLDDAGLNRLSRDGHLFLSLDEMRAIRDEYRRIGRDPTDVELETLAQTWSEHCVHKTLKSTVVYRDTEGQSGISKDVLKWRGRPGHTLNADGSVTIHNLLKSTVAAATHELISEGVDWTLSVFNDNSGVIAFDDQTAVCIKVETHNHPSAIEPYGGAATGAGGCIRDVIGTGLGARPIANTDVFCVAHPGQWEERTGWTRTERQRFAQGVDPWFCESDGPAALPPGTLHPRRVLTQVVAGVRDYGNRMGIPTISGAVSFDNRYIGNPLVFCGCIGVMPRNRVKGCVQRGDLIVALGGRTGRDGIHGATFSSAELEHTAADEFSHAVQIGNAITEKRVLDAILRARDDQPEPLYSGLTDCGAGGFSSAVGELGKSVGAVVHLERAPLKYPGLSYTEVWISEAQERMVLSVPSSNLCALERICAEEGVELAVLGEFRAPEGSTADNPDLQLLFKGIEVGRLSMRFLHDGIPTPHREALWSQKQSVESEPSPVRAAGNSSRSSHRGSAAAAAPSIREALPRLLGYPNIASKHWIVQQYDHEVRGASVIKPLVGPAGRGPGDASVICPVAGASRGLAVACGLQTPLGDPGIGRDPYTMTLAAIDECVRNLVCVGADPDRVAILDNFCWPSCKKPENLGSLVRAAEGCYDGAKAYRAPFVSGKDSLNNQLTLTHDDGTSTTIEIPPTLLITGIAIVPDVARCVTMDVKRPGSLLAVVSGSPRFAADDLYLWGTIYAQVFGCGGDCECPQTVVDLKSGPAAARAMHRLISGGLVRSAHDVSEGGLLVAVAEMLIAGSTSDSPIGAVLDDDMGDSAVWFAEPASTYVLEIEDAAIVRQNVRTIVESTPGLHFRVIGRSNDSGMLTLGRSEWSVGSLTKSWREPLDW